jgi:hypothetical protein
LHGREAKQAWHLAGFVKKTGCTSCTPEKILGDQEQSPPAGKELFSLNLTP